MNEEWQFYLVDGWIIFIGVLLTLYAITQLLIQLKVKDQEGRVAYSRTKIAWLLFLILIGIALVVMRVLYIVEHNSY